MPDKENFIKWMTNKWAMNTINAYSGKIDKISKDLKLKSMLSVNSLYEIKNLIDLQRIYQEWYAIPEFKQSDDASRKQESNAFKRYIEFRQNEDKSEHPGIGQEMAPVKTSDSTIQKELHLFALEEHLQDFLIRNLGTIKEHKLTLFANEEGRMGKEYPTDVGPIDILTTDEIGDFYVFETKLSKGADRALGQLLRYMGWVKVKLAKDKKVYGIIVANKMDEKIKYAVEMTPNVSLCEYEMEFKINFLDKM